MGFWMVILRTLKRFWIGCALAAWWAAGFACAAEVAAPPVPKNLLLVELHLSEKGDHSPLTRLFGDPKTGRVWEVQARPDGRVVGFFERKPWKSSSKGKTFEALRAQKPAGWDPKKVRK